MAKKNINAGTSFKKNKAAPNVVASDSIDWVLKHSLLEGELLKYQRAYRKLLTDYNELMDSYNLKDKHLLNSYDRYNKLLIDYLALQRGKNDDDGNFYVTYFK